MRSVIFLMASRLCVKAVMVAQRRLRLPFRPQAKAVRVQSLMRVWSRNQAHDANGALHLSFKRPGPPGVFAFSLCSDLLCKKSSSNVTGAMLGVWVFVL
jgi:hypothetical protein